ncbi:hypothetical protein H2248_000802 [Termitomyces sp. 'cryptogamus']|nr:hypothetical protein H2248_000802 [Termitomyces sp. 'cryptogamus']
MSKSPSIETDSLRLFAQMIFGKQVRAHFGYRMSQETDSQEIQDTHVPRAGRDLIRSVLEDACVPVSFLEVQAQHAFIRDEHSKGRWDAALTRSLFNSMLEVFERTVGRDLGPRVSSGGEPEHVC